MNVSADERIPWGDFFHPDILPVVFAPSLPAQDSPGWHITAFHSFHKLFAQQLEALLAEKMSGRMLKVLVGFQEMTVLIIYYQQNYPIESKAGEANQ